MELPPFLNLGAGFSRYFRIRPAVNDELRRAVFRIRHAVYCEELGYEPVRADGLESDAFDAQATHCVLQSIATDEYIGCVRLVVPDPRNRAAPLPFETLCQDAIDRSIVVPSMDRSVIAEVSRLAVIARYRRRGGEQGQAISIDERDFGSPERPRFPYIAAGLYLGMLAQARRHGIETLFMLTERRLAKQLTRLGVTLQTIGGPVEHRGTRYPSMMCVQEVLDGLSVFVKPLFAVIAGEIDDGYAASARSGETKNQASSPHSSFLR
jgi:N-acyl amino acid synthase of PEP-CTERM/exosortase system